MMYRLKKTAPSNRIPVAPREHWAREVMYRETRKLVEEMAVSELECLEISGDKWGAQFDFKSYCSVAYPAFDICESALERTFDLIIADQVFEHLLWPYRAGRNVRQMLAPGGYFLVTTPFLVRVHRVPEDCSRWTETGIRYLLAECGFDLSRIRTGSWGNRKCVTANFKRWPTFSPRFHSLKNEPEFPIVVWALARN